ncbi:MAG TPA: ATP-dependent DNA helicase PcrA [Candidatus Kaiserbacteria bacterium]|nr:ATP-dependent DNA helicase PcrA [Candidatus Kaiserbacteria bacterium]
MFSLDTLNERQKEAVLTTEGPIAVLAGAGSGKTRVLTTRMQYLLEEKNVPGKNILAVTFTNKAAREMRERMHCQDMPLIVTFHGLGRMLLEEYGTSIGIPRYTTIIDRSDSQRIIKKILESLGMDPKEVQPKNILSRIAKVKGEGLSSEEFLNKNSSDGSSNKSFLMQTVSVVFPQYEAQLRKQKMLDFEDLISLPHRMLAQNEEVRHTVQQRFKYVHIDEYQDTNKLQGEIAMTIAGKYHNIFVVGDIDQTIYTWRGATIDNLLSFEDFYPNAKTIILEYNYRSSKTIIDAANILIAHNKNRKEKRAITDNPTGSPIVAHLCATAEQEASWIAQEIKKEMASGTRAEQIAVLFRTNFQSRAIEEGLLHSGVPYRLIGTRFFERKEVKDVLAWVRLALDGESEINRVRAVQSPSRGIGKVTLGKMLSGQQNTFTALERTRINAFEQLIEKFTRKAQELTPSAFVRAVIEETGLQTKCLASGEEGQERLENMRELATLATRYDTAPQENRLADFLSDAALASDQDELDNKTQTSEVVLMTIHAAKGLEFDTVFITGMEEGLFPHERIGNEARDEEEERRLCYVAVTRAKKRLITTLSQTRRIYGTDYVQEPSSFLQEMDINIDHSDTPAPIDCKDNWEAIVRL